MKKLLLIILLLVARQRCSATDWLSYFVYVQTDYSQGPWKRVDMLNNAGSFVYLQARPFDELFGSGSQGLANAILGHLQEETPERYHFTCTLTLNGDIVVIETKDTIPNFDAVKNELAASFTLNNFQAVRINQKGRTGIYTLSDVSVPYMDLVAAGKANTTAQGNTNAETADAATATTQTGHTTNSGNKWTIWLVVSIALNLLLIILLLKRRR